MSLSHQALSLIIGYSRNGIGLDSSSGGFRTKKWQVRNGSGTANGGEIGLLT